MIDLQTASPHPALLPFVKAYWFLYTKTGTKQPYVVAPIPEQCLYFYPRSLPSSQQQNCNWLVGSPAVLAGQAIERTNLIVPDDYAMVKLLFQPGGLYRLFGTPMTLFTASFADSISVLGHPLSQLQEQIANADDFTQIVQLTDTFLLRQAAHHAIGPRPIDTVINQPALHHFSVDQLARDACLSTRQFERNFLERVGVSPKFYQRIMRFNQAMKLHGQFPQLSWLHITHESGYFDQMHLLRDFRQFTGQTPSAFDSKNALIY